MRIYLNRCIIFLLALLMLMNFYIIPKSTVAYNTNNLTTLDIMAKNDLVKSINKN